ncbi:MAG TPA: zinc metalloprotease HtpX [Jiangellales bacterium]|nr:zinc metalloprotease HtpX [Jiangellales bacterium]
MAQTRFRPDRGLSFRMGLTIVLLFLLYLLLSGVIWWIFGGDAGGTGAAIIAFVLPLGLLWGQWYFSDRLALVGMRGREVTPEQAPQLHAMVDRLCALADMPKPRVAVSDMDIPNAFATGRSPERAVVCVTTGLGRRLTDAELEAVLSHELSHVAHRDVTVMTVASSVGVLAGLLMRSAMWSSMGRGRDQNSGLIFLVATLVGIVVYAVSFLLTRVLSRYRELAADRAGAILTGQPAHLMSALTKISGDMTRIPDRDLRAAEPYNAFFIYPAFTDKVDFASLFATHPPLEKRLEQLGRLSRELGQPS